MKKLMFVLLAAVSAVGFVACDDDPVMQGVAYTLQVKPNKAEWGVATGSGTYIQGNRVDIEAVPTAGYYFLRWDDGAVSNPRTVTVSGNRTIYALFSPDPDDPNPYNPNGKN